MGSVGCSSYPRKDGERLNNEVYALLTQVNAMQQAVTELQAAERQQTARVEAMIADLADLGLSSRRNTADFGLSIDEMREEFARLRGGVDSFSERVSTLEAGFSRVQDELDLRFAGLAEQSKITGSTSDSEKATAREDARRREQLLGDPSALFAEASKLIETGRPADARTLLRELVLKSQQNAKLKAHQARAQFLIGETYFAEGKFQTAAAEYNTVRKNWDKSPLVPDALYKLGLCFERLKLLEDAKLFYRTVVQKYPRSSVASAASQRLRKLR